MHGHRLYSRRDLDNAAPDDTAAIRAFLAGQRDFQEELLASLRADPDEVERNSLLIWTWDYVSLALCLGWAPATARGCPTADGTVDLELAPGPEPATVKLDPWPFASRELTVRCEGRRLQDRFGDEDEMRAAFGAAPWETLEFSLRA
jgi:hypothetical protein